MSRVSEQCFSMTERTDDNVTLVDGSHSAAGQFELVVAGLVIQDTDGDENAFLAQYVGRQPQFVTQVAVLSNGSNFVDQDAAHRSTLASAGLQRTWQ